MLLLFFFTKLPRTQIIVFVLQHSWWLQLLNFDRLLHLTIQEIFISFKNIVRYVQFMDLNYHQAVISVEVT